MDNKIASRAIVKPILSVHFSNTKLTKSGVKLMEFKRRMGKVEKMLVTYNFHSMWETATLSMNPETTWGT